MRLELLQGARGDIGRARVNRAVRSLERAGRVVSPTHADWVRAGLVQGRIWDAHPSLRSKSLQNDLLIACTARRIGALIATANTGDFALIRPYLPHRALSMGELSRELGV